MEFLRDALDFIRHLDAHIASMIETYGSWTYAILAAIIFAETGLVVMPFLPGDSLLFAAGIFAHPTEGGFNLWTLLIVLTFAAILGDTVNYHVGKWLGPKMFKKKSARFFKPQHLEKTHAFFEKYGGKTIILARWVPIVRTFAPFVAGMGAMTYRTFLLYNVVGGFLWVWSCVLAGYWLGRIQWLRERFELVVLFLILLSLVPIVIETVKHKREAKRALKAAAADLEEALD